MTDYTPTVKQALILIIAAAAIANILPLLMLPAPENIFNGDIAYHTKQVKLLSKDASFILYDSYPKMFHVLSVALSSMAGVPPEQAMYAIAAMFSIVFVFTSYKLMKRMGADTEWALIATLLAIVVLPHTNKLVGTSIPVPQTLAMALFPLGILLFLNKRYMLAGLILGIHGLTHGSWPLTVIVWGVFALLEAEGDWVHQISETVKKLAKPTLFGFMIMLPWLVARSTIGVMHHDVVEGVGAYLIYIESPFPIISFIQLFWPTGIILLALYGSLTASDAGKRYAPTLASAAAILFLTQLYYFIPAGSIAGLTFISSRMIPFLVVFIAFFAAMPIKSLLKRYRTAILASLFALTVLFALHNYGWYEKGSTTMGSDDLSAMRLLESISHDAQVLYNPLNMYSNAGFVIDMSGNNAVDAPAAYMILGGAENASEYRVDFVLVEKGDRIMTEYTQQLEGAGKILENDGYILLDTRPKAAGGIVRENLEDYTNEKLEDLAKGFALSANTHPGLLSRIRFSEPTTFRFKTTDSMEETCITVFENVTVGACTGRENGLVIEADRRTLKEVLVTYSIHEFFYKIMRFYDMGKLGLTPTGNTAFSIEIPNPLRKEYAGQSLNICDLGITTNLNTESERIIVQVEKGTDPDAVGVKFRTLAKSMRFVITYSPQTFPNIAVGATQAILSDWNEVFNSNPCL